MKELAYKVFVDLWHLTCKYRFQKMDDEQWEEFIADAEKLLKRYKDTKVEYLFREIFMAVQSFYERF